MNKKLSKVIFSIVILILVGISVMEVKLYKQNKTLEKKLSDIKNVNLKEKNKTVKPAKHISQKAVVQPKQIDKIERAKQAAQQYIESKNVGVYFIQLNSGKSFGINQDKIYYAASTGKLPEILYTQKKLNVGIISSNTKFPYHDYVNNIPGAMIRGGTGILKNNIRDGQLVSVDVLLKDSCSYSDNLAANMLGYYVCDKNDGAFKKYIGGILSRNIVTFSKEFSARDIAVLMKEIYSQNINGGQAISYMKNTSWDTVKIPKYLPVKTAHKIGINGAYNHDAAIVYSKDPYVISIMTNGESDEFISQLSKIIYDEVNKS
ncbi:class A beta-lactamase-related serine hydrolase [Clostridium tyrobutyricum]|uniref:serine hydrolase n=1 Tax=Clostridium tyrobutyricum TaxID=1519 RepID=UPI001C392997|nr:serine hydrolase [Clostridium tyrobutyricum]MBV4420496.1 class A beta-lactamase-related serine hydrolase [Clostridium tyrobutyricum]